MALDFSLARVSPNIGQDVQASYEAGRERGRVRARDTALANYTTDPEGTATAVMGIDPRLGIQLAQVNRQNTAQDAQLRHQAAEEQRQAQERGNLVLARVIDDTLRIPEPQRREHLVTLAQGLAAHLPADQAQQLLTEAQNVDTSDAGLRGVRAGLAPAPADYTLGRTRFGGQDNQPIASVAEPDTVTNTPEGGTTTITHHPATPIPGRMASALAQDGATAAPGTPSIPPPPPGPMPSEHDAHALLAQHVPGFQFTGGARTPQRNAAVGGAPNSYHLAGQAMDFVAAPNVSRDQIASAIRDAGYPITELFHEPAVGNQGPHWHWAWGPSHHPTTSANQAAPAAPATGGQATAADGTITIHGQPRPEGHYGTAQENSTHGFPHDAVVYYPPHGTPQRLDRASDHPQSDTPTLTDEDLTFAAGIYMQTGQMPAVGQGRQGAALRQQILHRAAQVSHDTGESGADAAAHWAENRTAYQNVAHIRQRRTQIEQQAGEANNTADLVLQALPDGHNNSAPFINRPYRAFLAQAGNAGVTRFNNAVSAFAEVYARVMTGATGSAASSDSARALAHRNLNPDQTPTQIRTNIAQMRAEMAGQTRALDAAEQAALAQVHHAGSHAPAGAPAGGGRVRTWNPATRRLEG